MSNNDDEAWKKREEEIAEEECSEYFKDPEHRPDGAPLGKAITAALNTIRHLNNKLPEKQRYEDPMEYLANTYGSDCVVTLSTFDERNM